MYGTFILLLTIFVAAQAGLSTNYEQKSSYPQVNAVASTHESVVRSFDGTVSHNSKLVDTPYSSVRKSDTRINNNVYTPDFLNTVTYNAPLTKSVAYAAPVYKTVPYSAPIAKAIVSEPNNFDFSKVPTHYSSDLISNHGHAPFKYVPATSILAYKPPTATTTYQHESNAATFAHNDNHKQVSAYGSAQAVHYSPANMVSHMSFDGFGTQWSF